MNKKLLLVTLLCVTGYTISGDDQTTDLYDSIFLDAAKNGKVQELNRLLRAHPNIDVNAQDSDGYTALMLAAYNGHDDCVTSLLDHPGIKVNAQTKNGYTALMCAAQNGHAFCVTALIRAGASKGIKNRNGNTAYDLAEDRDHRAIMSMVKNK
ncbi:ankyrin repeat domain-containing protein [Candidatus Babeliales bacterium]|nr:ankyrin repeat domain-containing protein [Candidatus Babeliales bacterium]